MLTLSLLIPASFAQNCPSESLSIQGFSTILDEAEDAYSDFDGVLFQDAMDRAAFTLPCLAVAISPAEAARYHQLQGIRQFSAAEEERSAQAFAAARSTIPDLPLSEELVPTGHAMHALYASIPLENGESERIPVPETGEVLMNGSSAQSRPTSWPTVFQLQDPQGQVSQTTYLLPGEALPIYAGVLPEPPPLANIHWIKSKQQLRMLGSGTVLALAAGGTYALGAYNAATYEQEQPTWDSEAFRSHERKTNALVLGSAGMGLAAMGLITRSFLVVTW
ncbi:MAG: hypothetical protein ACI9VR_002858 [Cognaticolwellia sp.]